MIELIINATHTQTRSQRLTDLLINIIGWLLWVYFLFPLFALGCSLLDFDQCSRWVSMSGGYSSIEITLSNYLETVVAMVFIWFAWVGYNFILNHSRATAPAQNPVSRRELCLSFNVNKRVLKECQKSHYVVVHFDDKGHIIGLDKE